MLGILACACASVVTTVLESVQILPPSGLPLTYCSYLK